MKLTYWGHSCFSVSCIGKTILFDPFISPNHLASQVKLDQVKADYILISHAHEDHIADAIALAKQTGAKVVSNYEIILWIQKHGIKNVHAMNHGGAIMLDCARIKYVNAIHSSSFSDGSYGGVPGGFVVETPEGSFYYSGDTALTYDMKLIGECTRLRFAVFCIGDNFTMGVDDAIRAAEFVDCEKIVGVHYDTFPPIKIDHAQAKAKFKEAGKQLFLPAIGSTIEI